MVDALAARIAGARGEWPGPFVEQSVFGTSEPGTIAEAVTGWTAERIGEPADVIGWWTSVGCVAGLRLADGQNVAVKAHQPRWSEPFLRACCRVQAHLRAGGFPCPEPLTGPALLGTGSGIAHSWLPDPGLAAAPDHGMCLASAAALADLVARCDDIDGVDALAAHPFTLASGRLYPEPHSPIFDFDRSSESTAWVDHLARSARRIVSGADAAPVVGHGDWSMRNVRVTGGRVAAVYDWDSLCAAPEHVVVGEAAANWSRTGEAGDPSPSARSVDAFLDAYPRPVERDAARAAAVASWCYTARCELAIGPAGPVTEALRDAGPSLIP